MRAFFMRKSLGEDLFDAFSSLTFLMIAVCVCVYAMLEECIDDIKHWDFD